MSHLGANDFETTEPSSNDLELTGMEQDGAAMLASEYEINLETNDRVKAYLQAMATICYNSLSALDAAYLKKYCRKNKKGGDVAVKAIEAISSLDCKEYIKKLSDRNLAGEVEKAITKLNEVRDAALKVSILETQLLKNIYKDEALKERYHEYTEINKNFMRAVLFQGSNQQIIDTARQMDNFFQDVPEVAEKIAQRNQLIAGMVEAEHAVVDNRSDFATVRCYKRIYLWRRDALYMDMLTRINLTESYSQTIRDLIVEEKDFAYYELPETSGDKASSEDLGMLGNISGSTFDDDDDDKEFDITKEKKKNGDEIQRATKISDEILTRHREVLFDRRETNIEEEIQGRHRSSASLEVLSNRKTQNFVVDEISRRATEVNDFEKEIAEIDARCAELDEKEKEERKALEIKKKKLEEEKQKAIDKLKDDYKKFLTAETGAIAGKLIYNALNGKPIGDGLNLGKLTEKVAKKTAGLIAGLFLGPLGATFVESFLDALLPGPPRIDPVLEGIKEIKEKLDKIEEKIDELSQQMKRFEEKLTDMVNELPDQIVTKAVAELKVNAIKGNIKRLGDDLRTIQQLSTEIFYKYEDEGKSSSFNELINHTRNTEEELKNLVSNIYGLVLGIVDVNKACQVPDYPDKDSLMDWHFRSIINPAYTIGFYQLYELVGNIYGSIVSIFTLHTGVQATVNRALEVYYTLIDYNNKNGESQQQIRKFLFVMNQEREARMVLFHETLPDLLKERMLGSMNNRYLYYKMASYKDNWSVFDFTKGFGLEMEVEVDKTMTWQLCAYNYATGRFEKSKDGHPSRFFINPDFTQRYKKEYHLYCANNDCVQELIRAKVNLYANDTIIITTLNEMGEAREANRFRVVPLTNKEFNGSIEKLILGKEILRVEKSQSKTVETIIKLPLSALQLKVKVKAIFSPIEKPNYEYGLFLVEAEKEHQLSTLLTDHIGDAGLNFRQKEGGYGYELYLAPIYNSKKGNEKVLLSFTRAKVRDTDRYCVAEGLSSFGLSVSSSVPMIVDNRYLFSYLPLFSPSTDYIKYNATLNPGQQLYRKQRLFSERYYMEFGDSGNLEFYAYNFLDNNLEAFGYYDEAIKPQNADGQLIVMQRNGELAVYDKEGKKTWSRKLDNVPKIAGSYLRLNEFMQLGIWSADGQVQYLNTAHRKDSLGPCEYLRSGEALTFSSEHCSAKFSITTENKLILEWDRFGFTRMSVVAESNPGQWLEYVKMGSHGILRVYDSAKQCVAKFELKGNNESLWLVLSDPDKVPTPSTHCPLTLVKEGKVVYWFQFYSDIFTSGDFPFPKI